MLISIIIPYYNASAFFNETIRSVYAQKEVAFEVIVVNDGSTANETKFLVDMQAKYGYTLIYQTNKGVSAARNAGAKRARGNFVMFLDADDEMKCNALIRLLEFKDAFDVMVGDCIGSPNKKLYKSKLTNDNFVKGMKIQVGTTLIKRELFHAVNGFDERLDYSEDMDLWFRLWLEDCRFKSIEHVVLTYRIHENSSMNVKNEKLFKHNLKSLQFRIQKIKEKGDFSKYKHVFKARLETLHWYARDFGFKSIFQSYLFALKSNFGGLIFTKFLKNDWRYL
jgi:glycosyltransferase involved in cell wall biosynthesis